MYRPQSPDTSEAVDRMLMEAYRRMSPAEKMERVRALSRAAYRAAAEGIRRSNPDASDEDVLIALAIRRLGEDLVQRVLAKRRSLMRAREAVAFDGRRELCPDIGETRRPLPDPPRGAGRANNHGDPSAVFTAP